ncbi:MAG: PAS domain S-box protein, partial [Deltaproteobacteria bacterium]|nr:PAS domain S-box protein [Deltaproteobacteria bacterium]
MGIPSVKQDEIRIAPSPEFINFAVDRAMDAILFMDDNARIVYANRAASRTLRFTMDELFSMTLLDIDPSLSFEIWQGRWADLKERGTLLFQTEYRRKNGTRAPVEAVFSFIQFEGQEYSCSFARNMTARQRVESVIRLGRAELEKTLDAISDWVCLIDLDSKILRTNRRVEEISGLSVRSIIGQSCCEVLHGSGNTIHECP